MSTPILGTQSVADYKAQMRGRPADHLVGCPRSTMRARLVAALILVVSSGCTADSGGNDRSLLRAAATAPYPSVYEFTDVPDAAELMACLGGEQTIRGVVDTTSSVAAFGIASEEFPQVIWTPERVYVSADLVVGESSTEWVAIDPSDTSPQTARVGDALGSSLEMYAFATELPGHPRDLARSASEAASSIDVSDPNDAGDLFVTVVVPDDVLASGDVDSQSGDDLVLGFAISVDDRVDSVEVRSTTGSPDSPEAFGFTLNFDWDGKSSGVTTPVAEDVARLADLGDLRPVVRDIECALG